MSKIALITDTHYGARSDSLIFSNYFNQFMEQTFFPEIEKREIKTIIHLGDFFDRRKFVNYNILNAAKKGFLDRLESLGVHMHLLIGNHDCYYKGTSDLNSPTEVFGDLENVTIYSEPTVTEIEGVKFTLIPWINSGNRVQSEEIISSNQTDILLGHLEVCGYEVMRGIKYSGGLDPVLFKGYHQVLSGHFHHKHQSRNIQYLGAPYQITFADCGARKGFHIFDTDSGKLEFIENPHIMFHRIEYNDVLNDYSQHGVQDFQRYANTYVNVIVTKKTNQIQFDTYTDFLYANNPSSVKITEPELESIDVETDIKTESTLSILQKYAEALDVSCDKELLKEKLSVLYHEAISIGE